MRLSTATSRSVSLRKPPPKKDTSSGNFTSVLPHSRTSADNMALTKLFCIDSCRTLCCITLFATLCVLCINMLVMTETLDWFSQDSVLLKIKGQESRQQSTSDVTYITTSYIPYVANSEIATDMTADEEEEDDEQEEDKQETVEQENAPADQDMDQKLAELTEKFGPNKAERCLEKPYKCEEIVLTCGDKPMPAELADRRPRNLDRQRDLDTLLEGTAITGENNLDTDLAVCQFLPERKWSWHFPHAMEQFYRCFSFWQTRKTQQPVLLYEDGLEKYIFPPGSLSQEEKIQLFRNRDFIGFGEGILLAFMEAFNVQLVSEVPEGTPIAQPKWQDEHDIHAMRTPADANTLTNGIVEHYQLDHSRAGCPAEPPTDWNEVFPRVHMLNRDAEHAKRSLLNVEEIASVLGEQVLGGREIPISYFEGISFLEQVAWYDSVDIVVGPHGAQLTGAAFMPKCGAMLEMFPWGYFWNDYFGSLAETAGLDYFGYYVSDSPGNRTEEVAYWMQSTGHAATAKGRNLCPDIKPLVTELKGMVDSWRDCCRSQS